jgi:hypothetical protein
VSARIHTFLIKKSRHQMSRTLYIERSGDVSMPVPSRQAAELHRALDDEPALRAVRTFAADGLAVGECSGVVLAAAEELLTGPHSDAHRLRLGLLDEPSVLLFATEGVTDPAAYARAVPTTSRPSGSIGEARTG